MEMPRGSPGAGWSDGGEERRILWAVSLLVTYLTMRVMMVTRVQQCQKWRTRYILLLCNNPSPIFFLFRENSICINQHQVQIWIKNMMNLISVAAFCKISQLQSFDPKVLMYKCKIQLLGLNTWIMNLFECICLKPPWHWHCRLLLPISLTLPRWGLMLSSHDLSRMSSKEISVQFKDCKGIFEPPLIQLILPYVRRSRCKRFIELPALMEWKAGF